MRRGQPLERRTALRARSGLQGGSGGLQRGGRLRQRSERRQEEQEPWLDLRMAANARDGGRCRAERLETGLSCWGPIEPHHIEPVGEGGRFLCPLEGLASLCHTHHRWAHADSRPAAEALGLIRRPGR